MNLKNLLYQFLCLCVFSQVIFAMEESTKVFTSEIKPAENTGSNSQNQNTFTLKRIAFEKINQILPTLTLKDNPTWLLKNLPENEIEIDLKKQLIKQNGAAWWYCFGNKTTNLDLSPFAHGSKENIVSMLKISPDSKKLLIANDVKATSNIELTIYDFNNNAIIYKGSMLSSFYKLYEGNDFIEGQFLQKEKSNEKLTFGELRAYFFDPKEIKTIFSPRCSGTSLFSSENFINLDLEFLNFNFANDETIYHIQLIKDQKDFNSAKYLENNEILSKNSVSKNSLLKGFYIATRGYAQYKIYKVVTKNLAIISFNNILKVWDLNNLKSISTFEYPITDFKISNDGNILFITTEHRTEMFDLNNLKKIHEFENQQEILEISQDNTIIIFSDSDKNLSICSLENLINKLSLAQLHFIKLLYEKYNAKGYARIRSNGAWDQILKSFDPDLQELIFEKFNLRISCNN